MADLFVTRHGRTGEPIGLVAVSPRGTVSLQAVSRGALRLDVLGRGLAAYRRTLDRDGTDLPKVVAALAGGRLSLSA